MKLNLRHLSGQRQPERRRACGATLIEMLMSSSLGVIALSGMLALVVEVSNEQRRGVVDATLQQQAGLAQDKIARLVRAMSASETVILGDPVSPGSPFYRRVILARGQSPTYAREQIYYDPATSTLYHDPDRLVNGDEEILFKPAGMITLRNMYFFSSMKSDNTPDGSSLNVWMQFDDDGFARRHNANGTARLTQVTRSFTVKMRNN